MNQSYEKQSIENNPMEASYDRPMGVTLLAILLVFGGLATLVTQMIAFNNLNETASLIGVSGYFFQGAMAFLGLLGVTAGVGTWLGKKWGWWLALFYFAYAVIRNINVIISITSMLELYAGAYDVLIPAYLKYGVRIIWNGALLVYLCGETVTTFFKNEAVKKWKALLIVFGICVFIYIIGTVFNGLVV
ncbi:hypothetical protein [Paenibacillus vini]|uniref:Yip1 domain-containing protein n=1 Tax=Paenibacillus vini TaxID=1476024 RepID=A0ABQ4MJ54_9BACL|nr:hypothetical protein [Paenibacillus vini]GIP56024.1 hypothetical protein J42TS3_50590 [Paenibacillus vini]